MPRDEPQPDGEPTLGCFELARRDIEGAVVLQLDVDGVHDRQRCIDPVRHVDHPQLTDPLANPIRMPRLGGIGRRSRRIHAIRPPLGVQGPIGAVLPPNPAMMRSAFSRASRAPSGSPPASSAADKPASARPRSYGPP